MISVVLNGKLQLDLSKYFISPGDHECLHKISWESIEELLRYFSQDELMCYTRSCVTEYIMNLPAVMDKYASTSDTHVAISIHRGTRLLIGFPGQMLAHLTKIDSYITSLVLI